MNAQAIPASAIRSATIGNDVDRVLESVFKLIIMAVDGKTRYYRAVPRQENSLSCEMDMGQFEVTITYNLAISLDVEKQEVSIIQCSPTIKINQGHLTCMLAQLSALYDMRNAKA